MWSGHNTTLKYDTLTFEEQILEYHILFPASFPKVDHKTQMTFHDIGHMTPSRDTHMVEKGKPCPHLERKHEENISVFSTQSC